jgi:hypothetical protein
VWVVVHPDSPVVTHSHSRMLKPKRPEIGSWTLNVAKNQGSSPKPKDTFNTVTSGRSLKKDEVTHTSREATIDSQSSYNVQG